MTASAKGGGAAYPARRPWMPVADAGGRVSGGNSKMRRERTRVAAWRRTIAERRPSARFSADDMWRGIEREREKEREVVKEENVALLALRQGPKKIHRRHPRSCSSVASRQSCEQPDAARQSRCQCPWLAASCGGTFSPPACRPRTACPCRMPSSPSCRRHLPA